jgi:hypothetical protein
MPIKPIDLQSNIAQMHEVAKGEQVRTEGVVEQQHVLEKESNEKSRLVQSKVDENKKAERTIIMREEGKSKERMLREKEREKREKKEREDKAGTVTDNTMGRIIDVKK